MELSDILQDAVPVRRRPSRGRGTAAGMRPEGCRLAPFDIRRAICCDSQLSVLEFEQVASRTIFIAGAGIGGLTASLALTARGFRVVLLEKAEKLEETGAGLQLSPHATRVLMGLGLKEGR